MKKLFFILFAFIISIPNTLAAWTLIPETGGLADNFKSGNFGTQDIIAYGLHLIKILIEIAGVIAVILVMIGGYKYVIGSFSDQKESGKNTILYALIGFAICVLAWIIVDLIVTFLTTE